MEVNLNSNASATWKARRSSIRGMQGNMGIGITVLCAGYGGIEGLRAHKEVGQAHRIGIEKENPVSENLGRYNHEVTAGPMSKSGGCRW
jgi:hypothetical protein